MGKTSMFNFKRIAGLCAIGAACAFSAAAHAQSDAKSQAMTIVVPYGAGGIVDNTARAFAQKLAAERAAEAAFEAAGEEIVEGGILAEEGAGAARVAARDPRAPGDGLGRSGERLP